jgi:MFS family permease
MVLLLFIAGIINYLDRSALSVAAPLVSRDLGLDPADLGLIFSSFFLGYALFNFIGGWAADRIGGRLVFALAMSVWSLFCGLTALAVGFASLFAIRVIFGIGEGPLSTTINKMINNWFPHHEAASAVGIANCGTPLGGAIAGPIVGLLAVTVGWRISFVAIGTLGFIWLAFWLMQTSERPHEHPKISAEELREIAGDRVVEEAGQPTHALGYYLRQPMVLATGIAFFGYNYILFFFLTWFPSYLTSAQHLSIKGMSIATVLPWILGFVGLALGGWVSDVAFRRTGRALFAQAGPDDLSDRRSGLRGVCRAGDDGHERRVADGLRGVLSLPDWQYLLGDRAGHRARRACGRRRRLRARHRQLRRYYRSGRHRIHCSIHRRLHQRLRGCWGSRHRWRARGDSVRPADPA